MSFWHKCKQMFFHSPRDNEKVMHVCLPWQEHKKIQWKEMKTNERFEDEEERNLNAK